MHTKQTIFLRWLLDVEKDVCLGILQEAKCPAGEL